MTNPPTEGALLTIEKVLALKSVGLFELIAEEDLIEIAYIADEVHAAASERIMSEGEIGTSMYAIVQGSVRVHRGASEIARLGPGEVVGELATLDPEPRSADVTALEDTLLLRIESTALQNLMIEQSSVATSIIAVLCRRLRDTDKAVASPRTSPPPVPDAYKRIVVNGERYYGKHVLLGASACNERLRDLDAIRGFVAELVTRIDMVAYGETFAARFGSGIEIGISAVQLIETSAITIHTNDAARDLYLDVFSCKDFDANAVVDTVRIWFAPASIDNEVRLRR